MLVVLRIGRCARSSRVRRSPRPSLLPAGDVELGAVAEDPSQWLSSELVESIQGGERDSVGAPHAAQRFASPVGAGAVLGEPVEGVCVVGDEVLERSAADIDDRLVVGVVEQRYQHPAMSLIVSL